MVATTCLGRVIPREVDNRNHLVLQVSLFERRASKDLLADCRILSLQLQGMTFMSLYRDAREGSNQETEYNFGRAFHHLGESSAR